MASSKPLAAADVAPLLQFISHELRNPLGAIAMWLHLCRQAQDPAERARALAMIEDSVEVLTRIAGHLGDCSALFEEGPRAQGTAVELPALVRRAVETLGPATRRAGIALALEAPPAGEAVRVRVEPDRMARCLEALIWSAVLDRAPERALEVRIEADAREARVLVPLGTAAWRGVRPLREHLEDRSAVAGPSGLALPIAWEIVARYEGRLSHEVAGGRRLVVHLPRVSA